MNRLWANADDDSLKLETNGLTTMLVYQVLAFIRAGIIGLRTVDHHNPREGSNAF